MNIRLFIAIFCLLPTALAARPISYSGGSTLMVFSDDMKNALYYHYSPSYKYALGIEGGEDKYFAKDYAYFRFTYLLNRKNTQHTQRNLYFQSGISAARAQDYFYGVHGDWESRRWFVGFGYQKVAMSEQDYTSQFYQIGIAPYLGDYGDLHSWLMLKTKHNTKGDWSSYPMLKFFKGNFLVEIGYNRQTQWDTQFIYRF